MMRLWILLAAVSFAGSAAAENVLMKSNGLGAAAVGIIGVTAGAAALGDSPTWQGYPKGGAGLQFSNDALGGAPGDCASADGAQLAKALKDHSTDAPKTDAPDERIRMSDGNQSTPGTSPVFDSKAIYSSGQSVSCVPDGTSK
ncbi:MAG TPA: hypothetical protein VKP60_01510 [Magnetospirillaceae bacterium]|nr:hypothetical protein [Magnetospirillaceae bacterium]